MSPLAEEGYSSRYSGCRLDATSRYAEHALLHCPQGLGLAPLPSHFCNAPARDVVAVAAVGGRKRIYVVLRQQTFGLFSSFFFKVEHPANEDKRLDVLTFTCQSGTKLI